MSQKIETEHGTIILLDSESCDERLTLELREPTGTGTGLGFYPTVGVELTRTEAQDLRDALSAWLGAEK